MSDTNFESPTQLKEIKQEKVDDVVTGTISEVFSFSLVHKQNKLISSLCRCSSTQTVRIISTWDWVLSVHW